MQKTNQFRMRLACVLLALFMTVGILPPQAFAASGVSINQTNFPDKNFREAVKEFDTDRDGVLSEQEQNAVTAIDVYKKDIRDLKGIGYFPNLKELACDENRLTSLDLSKNTKLESLICNDNCLTSLDLSKLALLKNLECSYNPLKKLDVSKNLTLRYLFCAHNKLTSLDLRNNKALIKLTCGSNRISKLDLSNNPDLIHLTAWSNRLTELDVKNNKALRILDYRSNRLTSLDTQNLNALKMVYSECCFYEIPSRTFDYTKLPGNFDVSKVREVSGGSFDTKNHTFTFDSGSNNASYVYDTGSEEHATFTLCFNPFQDVNKSNYFHESVMWSLAFDIAAGKTKTSFAPLQECTRAQTVALLWRAAGSPEPESMESPFKDVQDKSKYYYKAVLWMAENEIVAGTKPDRFDPDGICTRGQVLSFLWRMENPEDPNYGKITFDDVQDPNKYYYKPVIWAAYEEIASGVTPDRFDPDGHCTRAQVVCFMHRCVS